ncbi:ankyrin repeat and fibronectin type-III domain-containing protein 1-like [Ascaphus truei]|uniref:ankyrin repeat and fibronectin type-III domain-containing protein 1-like n=1 Tax=Ascaphus truei TaxID=8439 RepID=UPI003F5A7F29
MTPDVFMMNQALVSLESRSMHLSTLVEEAQQRVCELSAKIQNEGLGVDSTEKEKQLKSWEWRYRLYKRMKTGFEHARAPEAPTNVCLMITSSTSLTVTFQEPLSVNSAVVTRYKVEWTCTPDFSSVAGEIIVDNLQSLRCTITGLTTVNAKSFNYIFLFPIPKSLRALGSLSQIFKTQKLPDVPWLECKDPSISTGLNNHCNKNDCVHWMMLKANTALKNRTIHCSDQCFSIRVFCPTDWKDYDGRDSRHKGQVEALERLLQQVRTVHQHYSCRESAKLQNPSRKQSVSRSLKHLFHSSNKFVKTLKRGLYIAVIFYYKDNMLVTNEDQIPIVEIDDSSTSSIMQDFLWFTKLSSMWDDIRWLRQSMSISMSSSTALQARQKMLAATAQIQNLLGTHNLGRVYYEPIKDRHGNVLIVTIREVESLYSFFNGKWIQISKLQSQRKSLSTPEEPTALDILLITIQEILSYQKRSQQRLPPGLYLGYLKLCSSVDQIKVLVSQRLPNMLCHVKVRDNSNVSKDEWEWIQNLSVSGSMDSMDLSLDTHTHSLLGDLQVALKALLKQINLPLHQAKHYRLYTQEVLELGHNVSFLLLLPASDDVCTAPGQSNPYTLHSGYLNLPLQMFELVHFCSYKEKFISLYCRLSAIVELDSLITQQALREAISDDEVGAAKQRHQHVLDYTQQADEIWREMRWITDALQYARYKQPVAGLPITRFIDLTEEQNEKKNNSTSSHLDCLPSPSPSPEMHRRKAVTDSQPCSDEEGCSEVFLPTDSDYDSSDALSPRELDLVYSSSHDISQQAMTGLSGSAPDVLQVHDMKPCLTLKEEGSVLDSNTEYCTRYMENLSVTGFPSKNTDKTSHSKQHLSLLGKKKSGKHQHCNYFSRHHRWLRVHSESQSLSLSEGVYTQHMSRVVDFNQEPTCAEQITIPVDSPRSTFLPHASSLPEDGKSKYNESKINVRRIYVEPYKQTLSEEERKPWTMSIDGSRSPAKEPSLQVIAGQEIDADEKTNLQLSEVFSSTL